MKTQIKRRENTQEAKLRDFENLVLGESTRNLQKMAVEMAVNRRQQRTRKFHDEVLGINQGTQGQEIPIDDHSLAKITSEEAIKSLWNRSLKLRGEFQRIESCVSYWKALRNGQVRGRISKK